MSTYKSIVTLPTDVRKFFKPFMEHEFFKPFMEHGTVTIEPEGDAFAFTFEATDLWDAHEVVSDAVGNDLSIEFERAEKVSKKPKVKSIVEGVVAELEAQVLFLAEWIANDSSGAGADPQVYVKAARARSTK